MIDFSTKKSNKQIIMAGKYGARWIDNEKQRSATFSKSSLKNAVKHLVQNCVFLQQKFRQVIEIPMELFPALIFGNLFLYCYESKWIKKKKTETRTEKRFANAL